MENQLFKCVIGSLGGHIPVKKARRRGLSREAATVHQVPPGDGEHFLATEPQTIQVPGDDGLNHLPALPFRRGSNGDFTDANRKSRCGEPLHEVPHVLRGLNSSAFGNLAALIRVIQMHLGADGLYAISLLQKRLHLAGIIIRVHIIIDAFQLGLRNHFICDAPGPAGIVSRQQHITALGKKIPRYLHPGAPVLATFVHNVIAGHGRVGFVMIDYVTHMGIKGVSKSLSVPGKQSCQLRRGKGLIARRTRDLAFK